MNLTNFNNSLTKEGKSLAQKCKKQKKTIWSAQRANLKVIQGKSQINIGKYYFGESQNFKKRKLWNVHVLFVLHSWRFDILGNRKVGTLKI